MKDDYVDIPEYRPTTKFRGRLKLLCQVTILNFLPVTMAALMKGSYNSRGYSLYI